MEIILLAFAVSFVLTLVIGRFVLAELRKLKAGQEIRADGPTWHKSKAGTPTMGGVMFILGVGITILSWAGDICWRGNSPICIFISLPWCLA